MKQTPLKKARTARRMRQREVVANLSEDGHVSVSVFSRIETGQYWPKKQTVLDLVEIFHGDITRDQILFPECYVSILPLKNKKIPGGKE